MLGLHIMEKCEQEFQQQYFPQNVTTNKNINIIISIFWKKNLLLALEKGASHTKVGKGSNL